MANTFKNPEIKIWESIRAQNKHCDLRQIHRIYLISTHLTNQKTATKTVESYHQQWKPHHWDFSTAAVCVRTRTRGYLRGPPPPTHTCAHTHTLFCEVFYKYTRCIWETSTSSCSVLQGALSVAAARIRWRLTGFSAAKQKFLEAAVTVDSAGMWSKMIFIRLQ